MTTHYHPDDFKHLEEKHEITNVDMTGYDDEKYFTEIKEYLIKVHGMNEKQVAFEMEKHFPDLWETQKEQLGVLL